MIDYVTAVIFNKDGKMVIVSRKNDHTDFNLPGGKIEFNESPEQAIAREVLEETGLDLDFNRNEIIYIGEAGVSDKNICQTYIKSELDVYSLSSKEDAVVKFGDYTDIIADNSSFKHYNLRLLNSILVNCFCKY
jgi:8-oxo-dGTP pyrophosphatase MutT (NUDIX family)